MFEFFFFRQKILRLATSHHLSPPFPRLITHLVTRVTGEYITGFGSKKKIWKKMKTKIYRGNMRG